MIKIGLQKIKTGIQPFSEEDFEKLKSFHNNQVLRASITGVKKPRSYQQLKMFWAGCKIVAENTDSPYWNTPEKVAEQIKHALKFYDHSRIIVTPGNEVVIPVRSISYENLSHMEACGFFTEAFKVMSDFLGVDNWKFLREVHAKA